MNYEEDERGRPTRFTLTHDIRQKLFDGLYWRESARDSSLNHGELFWRAQYEFWRLYDRPKGRLWYGYTYPEPKSNVIRRCSKTDNALDPYALIGDLLSGIAYLEGELGWLDWGDDVPRSSDQEKRWLSAEEIENFNENTWKTDGNDTRAIEEADQVYELMYLEDQEKALEEERKLVNCLQEAQLPKLGPKGSLLYHTPQEIIQEDPNPPSTLIVTAMCRWSLIMPRADHTHHISMIEEFSGAGIELGQPDPSDPGYATVEIYGSEDARQSAMYLLIGYASELEEFSRKEQYLKQIGIARRRRIEHLCRKYLK